jgi:hypothetical protein
MGRVGAPQTWILTGSAENLEATRDHGFGLIGLKEGRRRPAEAIAPGDRIVLYVTRAMAFAGSITVTGELFEDRTPVWPGKPGKADPYPWRFETEPEVVLEPEHWVDAETLADDLEHVRKWPREHWKLAFQGQIRRVSAADGARLVERLHTAAGVAA